MKKITSFLFVNLLLAGCQVYAGGGSVVSDGRTTTVRTAESELGTETGARARTTRTTIRND